eukprot:m51a1_g2808 putative protein kinase (634) ;mRNA; r:123326-127230
MLILLSADRTSRASITRSASEYETHLVAEDEYEEPSAAPQTSGSDKEEEEKKKKKKKHKGKEEEEEAADADNQEHQEATERHAAELRRPRRRPRGGAAAEAEALESNKREAESEQQRPPPPKSAWATGPPPAASPKSGTPTKSGKVKFMMPGSRDKSSAVLKASQVRVAPAPGDQNAAMERKPSREVVVSDVGAPAPGLLGPEVPHYEAGGPGSLGAADLRSSVSMLALSSSRRNAEPEEVPDEIMAMAFKSFQIADINHDGTIDENELYTVLKLIIPNITLPETNRLYQDIDRNRSGRITFDEFVRAIVKYKWNLSPLEKQMAAKTAVAAPPPAAPSDSDQSFEWEIPLSQIHKEAKLGEGTFGLVFKAKWRGCPVAVKEIRGQITQEAVEDFKKEITLMSKMRHPNIVLFMGASTRNKLAIVTEFVNGGSMYDIIHKQGATFTLGWLLRVAYESALGMVYLHGMTPQIVHRDLKPMNILVDRESNHVKLIDFGLSCLKPTRQHLTETVGSPIWMAPELLRNEPYTEKVDVYSYSLCLLEFFTGETPYLQLNLEELIQHVVSTPPLLLRLLLRTLTKRAGRSPKGVEGQRVEIPEGIPHEARDLIRLCWAHDPARRPSFESIIRHPVFSSVV